MHRIVTSSLFIALGLLGAEAGCNGSDRPSSDAGLDPQHSIEVKDIPLEQNRNLDLLFVVDNSANMNAKQSNLVVNFPAFLDVLSQLPGGLPNLHLGVVTSDLGTKGAEDAAAGPGVGPLGKGRCEGLGQAGALQTGGVATTGGAFLVDIQDPVSDGVRIRNYTGELATAFAQMATVGDSGCGFEQSLEAMKQALLPANLANAGFLRPAGRLAVVFVTDEDDCSLSHSSLLVPSTTTLGAQQSFRCTRFGVLCSDGGATTDAMNEVGPKGGCRPNDDSPYLTKVADYAVFLQGLRQDPKDVFVAAIAAPPEPFATELRAPTGSNAAIPSLAHSCSYVGGAGEVEVGDPPARLKFFLDQFPDRNVLTSICQQDQSTNLIQIASALRTLAGDPCIQGALSDIDAVAPGTQPRCTVLSVTDPDGPARTEKVLPICTPEDASATNPPCWHITTDATGCPNRDHFKLTIEGEATLTSDTHVVASCLIDAPM